ncbi:hypothetical protein ACQEVS_00105 [Streptomyces sp. CA-181903]|uniref:hypothetical protein n=1 Tax=Streptomyces sp. CA-181903 TaxID=3240055 RepID=UPI003D8AF60F
MADLACVRSGAVSVPRPPGASAAHPAPVVEQSGPRLLVLDVDQLDVALALAVNAPWLGRIVVIGHRPEATAHQEKLESARARLAVGAGERPWTRWRRSSSGEGRCRRCRGCPTPRRPAR